MKAMEISLTGLDVEWRRMEVIANNLSNMNTVQTSDGGVYKAMRLVSGTKAPFHAQLGEEPSFEADSLNGAAVKGIEVMDSSPRKVHEPGHPLADPEGYVSYPNIDHAAEMVLMVKTARAYEANLVAMSTARQMYVKALDMGRQS